MIIARLIMIVAALSVSAEIGAQNVLDRFTAAVKSHCVSFSYTYSQKSDAPVKAVGTIQVQGNAYILKGNGLEVWCDGRNRWTADVKTKELAVETVETDGDGSDALNPALIVGSLENHFRVASSGSTVNAEGKKLYRFVLTPQKSLMDIASLTVFFDESGYADSKGVSYPVIERAVFKMKDGTSEEFEIHSMSFFGKVEQTDFAFDMKRADPSWIVSDMR